MCRLTSDIKHSVDVGGAANGPAPMPLALAVKHALAVPPGCGVRLDNGGEGFTVCMYSVKF